MLDLLLYADDLESLEVGPLGRKGIPLSYCFMSLLGFPFKWAKTRGGLRVEWLGMETEYNSYRLGLTKKRAAWLVQAQYWPGICPRKNCDGWDSLRLR